MTAGSLSKQLDHRKNHTANVFYEHTSAPRVFTDSVIVEALRSEYPNLHLTVVPRGQCDLFAYAGAGNASLASIDNEKDRLTWRTFVPARTRLSGPQGTLTDIVQFGKYLLDWQGKEYVLLYVNGRDGTQGYPTTPNQYILSASVDATNKLLYEAGVWSSELHNEIWVFDGGVWQKDAELYESVMKARWEDVILDEGMKKSIIGDVENFFNGRETYERLRVPWKRGVIYYGPPGNGKTISIKAMMHTLYQRELPVPTLYVKSLSGFGGPEYSINSIFKLARRTAPCYLVFEDLDSLVTDNVRSYFLNAVDGIAKNDGIMMVGSTNHLNRLDPGISKRPSRFDRKYLFPNPNQGERTQYMKFWQSKLSDNKDVEFPDKLCPAIARITPGFSFAYLQEAMVASLLAIARDSDASSERFCLECMEAHDKPSSGATCENESKRPFRGLFDWVWMVRHEDEEDPDLDNYVLWREVKKQVRILKEELGHDKRAA
ncbi:ATPase family associated with various cellular activities (AAA) [Teratosphaeria destructans]|uniref:ATPase family associated with various cellular activities (AAA) n=1 Tax=Teratosphaeria destructans TaxID=418781 RepID=A0A9W7W5T8_9PEZI|nr:ATPase family associated with various cellular activities (AAA) [Teratosphaeria destructans]